ncbi:HNH endonuclease signature motif containing protein [Streptomyces sp. NPDC090306]|uniref:HNH endonuclease signature motif containing protein n=1 Tax=Streptomyces sp. NPDC090306 TaxID=3365961 RepID=UPI00382EE67F
MPYSPGRSGTAWSLLRARVFAEEACCWICHQWVDQALPRTHPMSRTVDHIVQLSDGGPPLDRANCRLAHRRCNGQRAHKPGAPRPRPTYTVRASAL